jgi:hypothetical protein
VKSHTSLEDVPPPHYLTKSFLTDRWAGIVAAFLTPLLCWGMVWGAFRIGNSFLNKSPSDFMYLSGFVLSVISPFVLYAIVKTSYPDIARGMRIGGRFIGYFSVFLCFVLTLFSVLLVLRAIIPCPDCVN